MRLKNSPRVTQAHHARLGKVLAVQRDEDVILPAAIDMQVALQVALLPEAVVRQHLAGSRVARHERRGHAVQPHAMYGVIGPQTASNRGDARAGQRGMDPVTDPALTDRAVLDLSLIHI